MSKRARITLNLDPETETETETEVETTVETERVQYKRPAASPSGAPKASRQRSAAAPPRSESVVSPAGMLNLGTVVKVALVGLVVISAVLLLKRRI